MRLFSRRKMMKGKGFSFPKFKRKRQSGSKFGKKLMVILITSLLLPVVITGSLFYLRFSSYMDNDIRENNAVILEEVNAYIQSELNNVTQVLTILSKVDYVQRMQPFLVSSMFENVQSAYDLIININVHDTTGRISFSTTGEEGTVNATYLSRALAGDVSYSNISIIGQGTQVTKVIRQAFPIINSSDQTRGVLVGAISMDAFEDMVQSVNLPEGVEILILSQDGLLQAHSDADKFIKLSRNPFVGYSPLENAQVGIVKSENIVYEGERYLSSYLQIPNLGWTVVVQIPENRAFLELSTLRNLFVLILVIALVFGFVGSRVIAKYTTDPLSQIARAALVASGGDFTIQIHERTLKRNDEFGDVGRAFMTMVESFREIITHLKDSSDVLDVTTESLIMSSESSKDVFGNIIDQAAHLRKTALEDLSHASKVVQNVAEMSDGSENVAQNTDRLNLLIKNNVDFATKGVDKMNHTAELIEDTVKAYEKIAQSISDLQKSAGAIGGISDSIMEIANQTNLLALNAAIEAARAGEAGKGFAVVASEIRNLADQSNKSAAGITDIIKVIQTDIKMASTMFGETSKMLVNVSSASSETVEQMGEILEDSKKAAESIDEISAVTEEHAATTMQINDMLESMMSSLEDTSKTSEGMSELINVQSSKNEETFVKIEEIKSVSERFKSITETFKC